MTCCCIVRDQYHSWRNGEQLYFNIEGYDLSDIDKWELFATWRLKEGEFWSEINKFYWKDFLLFLKELRKEKEANGK